MKKIISLLLVLLLAVSLMACGVLKDESTEMVEETVTEEAAVTGDLQDDEIVAAAEDEEDSVAEDVTSGVVLSDVRAAMIEELGITDPFLLETEALLNLYGITAESVKQSSSFATMAGTFPDEVIMVEAIDEAAAEAVALCLQNRLDEVMVQSQTYDADNYAAAQQCQVWRDGLFVSLFLSPLQAEMVACYQNYIG